MIQKNKKMNHHRVDYTILIHAVLYKSILTSLSARGVAQWQCSSFSALSLSLSLSPIYCLSPMLFISLPHTIFLSLLFTISLPFTIYPLCYLSCSLSLYFLPLFHSVLHTVLHLLSFTPLLLMFSLSYSPFFHLSSLCLLSSLFSLSLPHISLPFSPYLSLFLCLSVCRSIGFFLSLFHVLPSPHLAFPM